MSGDWYDDDGAPSEEDVERFSDDTAYCPNCGAEISDLATFCPECGDAMPGGPSVHPPIRREAQNRATTIVIALLVIAILGLLGVWSIF